MLNVATKITFATYAAFTLLLIAMGIVSLHISMETMFVVSILMLLTCAFSAMHLFGVRSTLQFMFVSISIGFFSEYMGHHYGWFFGEYKFTDALGPRLLDVPVVIPLMWFNLSYICFILGNLILHRTPRPATTNFRTIIISAFFGAMLVTAYDLGADPYMVFVAKAWVMAKKDGWWFTETLQGFVGWMGVSFVIITVLHLFSRRISARPLLAFTKIHALIPVLIYANLMMFQVLFGFPVETRTIALFAMGIPLLAALFSFADWAPVAVARANHFPPISGWPDVLLDHSRLCGDAPVDKAMASEFAAPADFSALAPQIAQLFATLKQIELNADLAQHSGGALLPQQDLPSWAQMDKIIAAEKLFQQNGAVSCILLSCACLPEVYVMPDISAVLHATGNLERMTEQRIRTTSAMILAVLLPGGIHEPQGAGRVKIMKARTIHGLIRYLFLRGTPINDCAMSCMAPLLPLNMALSETMTTTMATADPFEIAYRHGWNPANDGVPCNQEELAYTLLTFSFVYLRSLRRLGLAYPEQDEQAYLHFWNVVGDLMGVKQQLMAHTMADAAALFARLQTRARSHGDASTNALDQRALLGEALLNAIEKSIPYAPLKPVAALILHYLTSEQTARDLGLTPHINLSAKYLFLAFARGIRLVDKAIQFFKPNFSFARFILRIAGYQLIHRLLTDQDKQIELPATIRSQINLMLNEWSHDACAPDWLNHLEDYFTTKGKWSRSIGV